MSGNHRQKETSEFSAMTRRLVDGVILLNLIVYVCAGFYLYHSWNVNEDQNEIAIQNLAKIIEDNISGTIDKINLSLFALKDEIEEQLAEGVINVESLDRYILKIYTRVPDLESVCVADAQGDLLKTTGEADRVNISDRDYFVRLRDNPQAGLEFGKPVVGRISGRWLLNIGRRINHMDGSFAGIVFAQLTENKLTKYFSQVDLGKNGSIALRNSELDLVARYPGTKGIVTETDRKRVSETFRELVTSGRNEATFKARYPVDNIERLYSFHRINEYPLLVNVGRSTGEYIAHWRKEAVIILVLLLLFSLVSFIYSRAMILRWRTEIQTEEELRRANEELEKRIRERTAELSEKSFELQKSEECYRTVADYTSDWEYWIAPDGSFRYNSPSCRMLTGYDREEFLSNPELLVKIIHPDDLKIYHGHHHSIGPNDEPEPVDFRIITRGGEERWLGHRCRQVFDENGIGIGWRGSNRDITDRVRMEENLRALNEELDQRVALRTSELERLNSELQSFCYNISHELRAPLARIEGFSDAIAESVSENNPDESLLFAKRICEASRRLKSVIDNLLLLNRLSRADLAIEQVNLSELARQIMDELLTEEVDRTLKVAIEPDIVVQGDRSMLSICLKNLLGNAVKYTAHNPDGEIGFGETCQSGEIVYFVSDNGVGFDMAYSDKLFEPFCRLHKQAEFEGSGIGLAIVHRIIERHGGRIWAVAGEGEGATFYFNVANAHDLPGTHRSNEP